MFQVLGKWDRLYKREYLDVFRRKLGVHHCMVDDIKDEYLVAVSNLI